MAGAPLTDQQRADILADIQATAGTADGSVRKIAARHGVGMGSVRRIADAAGCGDAWESGSQRTAAANGQKREHLAQRRLELQSGLIDDAEHLRAKLFDKVTHLNVVRQSAGPGESYEIVEQTVLDAGPQDWRATMGAIAQAAGRIAELARLDAEANAGEGEGAKALRAIADGVGRQG